jgi:carboxymethylenebutenolidase
LVHEVFGADRHMEEVAARFAAEGYATLLTDLYSRAGVPGPASTEQDSAPAWSEDQIQQAVASLPDRRALADLDAAARVLGERPDVDARSIAAVGFCMGGTQAFMLGCTSTRVAAVVSISGRPLYAELSAEKPIQPLELALNLDRPLLAFFGGRDASIPAEHVELLRERLAAAAKDFEIVTYPEAGHGFMNDRRGRYDAEAAADAWRRTLTFLRSAL